MDVLTVEMVSLFTGLEMAWTNFVKWAGMFLLGEAWWISLVRRAERWRESCGEAG